jgi:hypothetical protein
MTTLSPSAPALTQAAASSLILCNGLLIERRARLNTQAVQCFQTIHGTSSITESSAFRIALDVPCLVALHHSKRVSSFAGGLHDIRSQARISCQIWPGGAHAFYIILQALHCIDPWKVAR